MSSTSYEVDPTGQSSPSDVDRVRGSFRDPSGFVFYADGRLYRQVNHTYREHFEHLLRSGLYDDLSSDGLLIPHEEVASVPYLAPEAYKFLLPEPLGFVSYPYEWCFSQLKAAALATIRIQKRAFEHGMTLKDASAYNIQFRGSKPVMIDTLSFEIVEEGAPWVAYRQFCQHFLAPLALMAYRDARLGHSQRAAIDGVELDVAAKLLPLRTFLRWPLLLHVHLHARAVNRYGGQAVTKRPQMSRGSLLGLFDSLESAVSSLEARAPAGGWSGYYSDNNYNDVSFAHKGKLVEEFLKASSPRVVWDLGSNTGHFSRIAARQAADVVSFDFDYDAVELNYRECRDSGPDHLLPLRLDLANPSPALGWAHQERMSLEQRGPADVVLALALVHHLAIGNNTPLESVADYFSRLGRHLIIEFVPKEDSQVQRLLASRRDIFDDYTSEGFEAAFGRHFEIQREAPIEGSARTLYSMRSRHSKS